MLPEAHEDGSFPKWFALWRALCYGVKMRSLRSARAAYYIWTAPLLRMMGDR